MPQNDLRMMTDIERGRTISMVLDGRPLEAFEGESVAAALFASGTRTTRWTARTGEPRGYFCGMGICQDCLVTIDGVPNVRACMTLVRSGLRIETQRGLGDWEASQ